MDSLKDKLKEIEARTKLTRQLVKALKAGLNIDDIKRALKISAQQSYSLYSPFFEAVKKK